MDDPPEAQLTQANGQAGRGGMAASAAGAAGVGLGPSAGPTGGPARAITNGLAHQPAQSAREQAVTVATYRNRDNQVVPCALVQPIQRPKPAAPMPRPNSLPSSGATQPRTSNAALLAQAQVGSCSVVRELF